MADRIFNAGLQDLAGGIGVFLRFPKAESPYSPASSSVMKVADLSPFNGL